MPASKAQIKATTKYEHNNYKKICIRLPAEEGKSELYDQIASAAEQAGQSINGYILEAVQEKMNKDK